MNITRNAQIAGIPGKDARDYVRQVLRFTQGNNGLSASRLPLPRGHKTNVGVLQRLLAEGFLELNEVDKTWRVTNKGVQLAGARIGNRIAHDQAVDLVLGLVQRAREINSIAQLLVEVRSIHVFGSVVDPEIHDHGDIDISFTYGESSRMVEKYHTLDALSAENLIADFCARMNISPHTGKSVNEDLLSIQRRWIKRELSCVSRYLSVADFTDIGMRHITGANHIVFFSYRDESGDNYQQWSAKNSGDITGDRVRTAISSSGTHFELESARTLWGIEERWNAEMQGR